jgi:hypothetical protein
MAPVAVKVVTEVSAPMVEVVVTAPVVELTEMVWKPFCERTGPLKVEFAIIKSSIALTVSEEKSAKSVSKQLVNLGIYVYTLK